MNRSIPHWQIAGFLFTAVIGTFLHFLFDLTGENIIAALFSAVNESIWEHTKLLFYPMLAFAVIEYFRWGKQLPHFWCVKLIGIGLGLVLIPVIYYTYTGILGINADWFNIAIFFLAALAVYRQETKLFLDHICLMGQKPALGVLCFVAVIFTVFTFLPPHIPFFQDPLTGTYGFGG